MKTIAAPALLAAALKFTADWIIQRGDVGTAFHSVATAIFPLSIVGAAVAWRSRMRLLGTITLLAGIVAFASAFALVLGSLLDPYRFESNATPADLIRNVWRSGLAATLMLFAVLAFRASRTATLRVVPTVAALSIALIFVPPLAGWQFVIADLWLTANYTAVGLCLLAARS